MNTKDIIVFDFETTGRDPLTCELTQIAACVIHPRKLTIGETFNSEVRPLDFDAIEADALKITRKTKEGLEKAPHPDQVWPDFVSFVERYNSRKSSWTAPIGAGYNIDSYDMVILDRYAKKYKNIDDKGKQKIFSTYPGTYDLLKELYWWNENKNDLENLQFTTVRRFMGIDDSKAHDALNDVLDCAKVMIRFMKLKRELKVGFKGAFARA